MCSSRGAAVASSDCADAVAATVTTLGLDDLVVFTCGYDSGHGAKPSPGMVNAFAAAAGILNLMVVATLYMKTRQSGPLLASA